MAFLVGGPTLWTVTSAGAATTLTNPSLELGWTSTSVATCWQLGEVGSGAASLASSSTARTGSAAAKLSVTSLASGGNRKVLVSQKSASCAPTATPGHQYVVSAWYQASAEARMVVYYRDSGGVWRWWAQSPVVGSSSAWRALSYVTPVVPAGATAISFGPSLSSSGWLLVDDAAFADRGVSTPTPAPGTVVRVATASQLSAALSSAAPGHTIVLADGTYTGRFALKRSGTATAPIRVTGGRNARLDGGSVSSGYTLHLDKANYVRVDGITVTNSQKGIVLDQSTHSVLTNLDVYNTGSEAVLLRNYSSDNVVSNNEVHATGRVTPGYGEGIYVGLAVSNWASTGQSRTGGGPDTSDRNQIIDNHIHHTTAESIDIKEGSTGGLIARNRFDSTGMSGANYADSWVDIAGNSYLVRDNTGVNPGGALRDGFQTHVQAPGWAKNNVFQANSSAVSASGYAINIQTSGTGNVVRSTNTHTGAARGMTNIVVTP